MTTPGRRPPAPPRSRPARAPCRSGCSGEVRKTTSGACVADLRRRRVGVEAEVRVARGRRTTCVRSPGDQRMHGVGRLEAQRRAPRPPKRLEQLLMTSLEPLAAQTRSAVRPWPRYAARSGAARSTSRSGYRFRPGATAATASVIGGGQAAGGRVRVLVRVQQDRYVDLRRPVGLHAGQVGAQRQVGAIGSAVAVSYAAVAVVGRVLTWNRARTAATWAASSPRPRATMYGAAPARPSANSILDQLEERQHGQPAGVPGTAPGGQRRGWTRAVVAQRDRE